MPKIHAIRTGLVQVRRAQMSSRGTGLTRTAHMLLDQDWSEWLPIYSWVIEPEEGIIVVDTGETSRVHQNGYHPSWHPFYRRAVRFSVHPDEELGPQLLTLGMRPRDVRQVVLTHLHTDHAGGLVHVTGSRTWVSRGELARASGFTGKVQGYLPHRWPKWWQPEFVRFDDRPVGPFLQSMSLTSKRDVLIVPTPGHTPHHVSVLVCGTPSFFLAGDTSYTEGLLLEGKVDGVSPDLAVASKTLSQILAFAEEQTVVYLPSHDPESATRLEQKSVLRREATKTGDDSRARVR
ncbi:MAG: N-acyl homoserine lactonase family protein [Acidobacteriaceae bacterium]